MLKGAYQLLHDTPARREDCETITKSVPYPHFCSTRWVENRRVADRLVEIWPNIMKLFGYWTSKKKEATSRSAITVKNAISDPLITSKLTFFSFVASKIKLYLTKYHANKPLIPFMYHGFQ